MDLPPSPYDLITPTPYRARRRLLVGFAGIGAGFVSYVLVKVTSGKAREVHPAIYVVAAAFLLYFLRWALFDARF